MIDLERETPVTLREAPALVPAINAAPGMDARKPLHPRTIYNWATKGKRGVVLETLPIGGLLVTTRQALVRFFGRLASQRDSAREQRLVAGSRDRGRGGRRRPAGNGSRRHEMSQGRERLLKNFGI